MNERDEHALEGLARLPSGIRDGYNTLTDSPSEAGVHQK